MEFTGLTRTRFHRLSTSLFAVIMCLRRGVAPMKIHTDNQSVVDGWRAGPRWTTGSGKTSADLWREFWFLADSVGQGLDIVKVRPCHREAH